MPLSTLPNEILSQILSHASPSGTRYNCLLVNRRFYSLMLPIIYRSLQIPFINHNRLVTFIRTVRRNSFLGPYTKSLCLGEDPFDNKRSVERIIGSNDINKLFPFLYKIELFAMTFERGMLYRFWAYCARAACLGEVVVHYPDLVPLVQPIKGLKKLTWSFTGCWGSPVLLLPEGWDETKWIAKRWLKSLESCTPELETLVVGCVGREGTWGISDRIGLEVEAADRKDEIALPKFEKLREFEWREGEGIAPVAVWWDIAAGVMEEHKDQLERVRWELAICGGEPYSAEPQGVLFWSGVRGMKKLKKLEVALYPGTPVPSQSVERSAASAWSPERHTAESYTFMSKAWEWDPRGLEEFTIRFSIISASTVLEKKVLGELEKAKGLKKLEMTFGIPVYSSPSDEEKMEFHYWYYQVDVMTEIIENLPTTLETLTINFDGKHDVRDKYRQYEFGPMEDTVDKWDEDGSIRAQIKDIVNQRQSIPKRVLYDRMPNLRTAYIGGYDLVGGTGEAEEGMAGISLGH
ncbi:hypothetical protein TWF106_002996 [Orbilia oligospora]|uniref:F-box domain-containing protein n=1 Tax=Orbilia oligospora TaxID=2813651 RepID=A0A7C8UVC2_ORBOL|nr:hypothetical protein TWF106_002996 [Orbilia oligospora]